MKFSAIYLDKKRLGVSGCYSLRLGGALVCEFDRSMPYTQLKACSNLKVHNICLVDEGGEEYLYGGPFYCEEKLGLLIFTPEF